MNTIRIAFTDYPGPFNPIRIEALLRKRFNIEIDQDKPDYVIYGTFGFDFLKYEDCIRIYLPGENEIPDFNLCDFAFGYHWLDFEDRYQRLPNYLLYDQYKDLLKRRRSRTSDSSAEDLPPRFCNFIYTNGIGHPFRDQLFEKLHAAKKVDSAGAHLRNIDEQIGDAYKGDWTIPKVDFQKQYRFSIACENAPTNGYTTEKIIHALAADTIPIYWGNPEIGKEFNTKRFINCYDYQSLDDIVDHIMSLENDPTQISKMLQEPFFPDDQELEDLSEDRILQQFDNIFSADKEQAIRRNLHFWGKIYEDRTLKMAKANAFVHGKNIWGKTARAVRRLSGS
ncbi:MAG: glycosyltransferase family 10 [Opitutales bacterium]|jgi:alpha(1,3/1,4) fucosyltransferase|nr:glycosyltransferase family 10 [Opitutales bacterium]